MTPLVLLTAFCGLILDLNPTGPQYAFLDYMAPAAMVGKHLEGDNTPNYTVKTTDAVWIVKAKEGYPWDKNLYDADGIWAWRTENVWGDPTTYTTWLSMHQVSWPRAVGQGRLPWDALVLLRRPLLAHDRLRSGPPVHNLGGTIINELWGPYTRTPAWGNLGTFQEITLVYGYGCYPTDQTTPATEACTSIETTWWTAEYGGVWWALYGKVDGAWVMQNHSQSFWVLDGTTVPFFPCDK